MQFAESLGASMDANRLNFDPPDCGEGDLYGTQREDIQFINSLIRENRNLSNRNDVIHEVLHMAVRLLTIVQSRMALLQPEERRQRAYRVVRDVLLDLNNARFRRAFIDTNSRENMNQVGLMVLLIMTAFIALLFYLSVVRMMLLTLGLSDVTAVDELVSVKCLMLGSLAAACRMFCVVVMTLLTIRVASLERDVFEATWMMLLRPLIAVLISSDGSEMFEIMTVL